MSDRIFRDKSTGKYWSQAEGGGELEPVKVYRDRTTGKSYYSVEGRYIELPETGVQPRSEQQTNIGQDVLRGAEYLARGAMHGAGDLVGGIADLSAAGIRATGLPAPPEGHYTRSVREGLDAAGKFISTPLNVGVDFGPAGPRGTVEKGLYGAGRWGADAGAFLGGAGLLARLNKARQLATGAGRAALPQAQNVTGNVAAAMGQQPALQVGAGAAGGAVAETTDNPYLGMGASVALPVAGQMALSGARRAVTPFASRLGTEEQRLVRAAIDKYKIPLLPGTETGSRSLSALEHTFGKIPWTEKVFSQQLDAMKEAFTKAALRRAGIEGDNVAPDVIDRAHRALGQEFDDLAERTVVNVDRQMFDDVNSIVGEYRKGLPSDVAAVFDNYVDDIMDMMPALEAGMKPQIPGASYQKVTSAIKRAARRSVSNPELQHALYDLSRVLDDALERTASAVPRSDSKVVALRTPQALTDPMVPQEDLLAAWKDVRRRYRNLLLIEKAAARGTQDSRSKAVLSYGSLTQAAKQMEGFQRYARGIGDFDELSRVGDLLAAAVPRDSGTAQNRMWIEWLTGAGLLGVGAIDPTAAAIAGGAAYGGPKGVQALYNTPLIQAYLRNQKMGPGPTLASRELLTKILAAQGGARMVEQR